MSDTRKLGFDTMQIHAGAKPDPATGARQVPIYQTTAYVFRDADHAAKLFNLQEVGYIYSRLTNPTVSALADRVAALEGGAGAVCCSSGHAAQIMALFPLMQPGCNVIAATKLYGGTIQQFSNTIRKFGWSAKFVDFDDLAALEAAIDENTRAIFCESIANPGGYITDLPAVAKIADKVGLPLIVDNTSATPYLCRPIEHGATLVVHSATKYLTGNGTVTGGVVVDYLGLALTDEGRTRALAYDEAQKAMIERQCQGWGASYMVLGPFGLRVSSQTDPVTKRIVSYTIDPWEDWNGMTIWMDGRAHPSESALHTQAGFTTGRWEGGALAARTTHMKVASSARRACR